MSQPKGVSDILGCYQGRMLAIEVKPPSWKPPLPTTKAYKHFKEQEDFIFQVNQAGGIGFFAQSAEEVVEKLGLNVKLYKEKERWIKVADVKNNKSGKLINIKIIPASSVIEHEMIGFIKEK